eukprot:3506770-Rhodomonas_salina.2
MAEAVHDHVTWRNQREYPAFLVQSVRRLWGKAFDLAHLDREQQVFISQLFELRHVIDARYLSTAHRV